MEDLDKIWIRFEKDKINLGSDEVLMCSVSPASGGAGRFFC